MSVTALIVTYNRLDKLRITLEATLALPFEHVVIINNASTDETSSFLANYNHAKLHVINLATNMGGAGGFKHGAKWIIDNLLSNWILFFDDDAYPKINFFKKLKSAELSEENIYCCAVKDKNDILCKMNIPWKEYPRGLFSNIKYCYSPTQYLPELNKVTSVVSTSFVGLMISHENLKKSLHYIHQELFIYFDDVYFGTHLKLADQNIIYQPDLEMVHDVTSTNEPIAAWKIYYLIRNLLLSKKIFHKSSPFDTYFILIRLFRYFFFCVRQRKLSLYLKIYFRGIRDGVIGKTGKGF